MSNILDGKKLITYYHNKSNEIIFKVKEGDNIKFIKVSDYKNFFFVKKEDVEKTLQVLNQHLFVNKYTNVSSFIKFTSETENEYAKISYITNVPIYQVTKDIIFVLDTNKIKHFEADLCPGDNYVIDNQPEINDDYRILFWDIETKDTQGGIEIGRDRILSICAIDNIGKEYVFCYDDEKQILQEFISILDKYDIIVGWNSDFFDSPYIKARLKVHGIYFSFKSLINIDLMTVFQASFVVKVRSGQKFLTSYSLDNVCKEFISAGKFEIKEGGTGYGGRIFNLFVNDRKSLIEYNLQDAKLMKLLNEEFKLIENEIMVAKLVRASLNKTRTLMSMLDMLFINEARKRNMHLKSKNYNAVKAKYPGGFVYDAKPKMYYDVNIFDVASLYPNLFMVFNMSPDTLLEKEEFGCIKLPNGTCFKQKTGLIPDILGSLTALRLQLKTEQKKLEEEGKTFEALQKETTQVACKLIILSIYGCVGSAYFRNFDLKVAAGITETGQFLIQTLIKNLQEKGYEIAMSDTDSVGVCISKEKSLDEVKKIIADTFETEVRRCGVIGKNTFKMEHEKIYSKLIILAKKKYCGLLIAK